MNAITEFTDHAGVIHLHSAYSYDGRTPVAKILRAAAQKGVAFLLLTDHDTLKAREAGLAGWHDGTLLVVGEEIAPRFNHYLAFKMTDSFATFSRAREQTPQSTIDTVRSGGGMGFIAHPDHKGAPMFHVKHYPWMDWSVSGYTGMGIWDFMTDWQSSLSGYLRAVLSYAFPAAFLRGPAPETLARWDLLTRDRRVVGIGELDNHDTLRRFLGFTVPVFPYSRVFRLIRTHVLTEKPFCGSGPEDTAALCNALGNGRAYVALDYYRPSSGFSLLLAERGRYATMGDLFDLQSSARLTVRTPYPGLISIIRNGALLHRVTGKGLVMTIGEPGVYRVEVSLRVLGRNRPWIYSNPLYVTRRGAARLPKEAGHPI